LDSILGEMDTDPVLIGPQALDADPDLDPAK
jgi:hypothetical protein